MPNTEFDLINTYFKRPSRHRSVVKGVGDDCAVLALEAGKQLVMSMDTIVAGTHFPATATADQIGSRAFCTSLSDLAAMGATPQWFTLALTVPEIDSEWLRLFGRGLFAVADRFECDLIGGDTTQGPLCITVQVHGEVDVNAALYRSGAQVGDTIFVSHYLGDGAAALAMLQQQIDVDQATRDYLLQRFYAPEPQIVTGQLISAFASAAIDISDGLLADAQHIADASHVDMHIQLEQLPLAPMVQAVASEKDCRRWALTGGDDYQLLFTVPKQHIAPLSAMAKQHNIAIHAIGHVSAQSTAGQSHISCSVEGQPYTIDQNRGYQHFTS